MDLSSSASSHGVDMNLRLPCSICGRKFAPDVVERHERICEKTGQKRRKTFDSAKQRIVGTDLTSPVSRSEPTVPPLKVQVKKKKMPTKITASRNHNNNNVFLDRLKSAPVQCPTCERHFSEKAADRHVPWCKEQKARIPRSPPSTVAKHRLAVRMQYKAPSPGKHRCTAPTFPSGLRQSPSDKVPDISPSSNVTVTGTSIWKLEPNKNHNGSSSNLSTASNQNGCGGIIPSTSWEYFSTNNVAKQQSPNSTRPSDIPDDYDPFEIAEQQLKELRLERPLSPELTPKSGRRQKPSTAVWSVGSSDVDEELDVVFEDEDRRRHSTHGPPSRFVRHHPRRTVSREEALFGKPSTGSLDSDYGSMLRRSPSTPAQLCQRNISCDWNRGSSRSSSETSLPPIGMASDPVVVARFCHGCGAKYPVDEAKFCCECGERRLRVA